MDPTVPEASDNNEAAARWAEAERRARHDLEHGEAIKGPSLQATAIGFVAFVSLLAALINVSEPRTSLVGLEIALLVVAFAVVIVGYIAPKRNHRLLRYLRARPDVAIFAPLTAEERRAFVRQLRGRYPLTPNSSGLAKAVMELTVVRNRAVILDLIGMFLALSAAAFATLPWLLIGLFAVLIFVVVASRIESRRWGRLFGD